MKKPDSAVNADFSISNEDNSPQKILFDRLSNKWFLMLLADLFAAPCRFNQLLRKHQALSQKMLSQTLKHLEEDGLISREVNGNKIPATVTYSITPFGRSLIALVRPLFSWSNENVQTVLGNRRRYNKKYFSPGE